MTTHLNWGKLVAENRAKAAGIPWTDAESKAIAEGMDPDDVRNGFLTKKDLDGAKEKIQEMPLKYMKKAELMKKAKSLGIEFDEMAVTRGDLMLEIDKIIEKTPEASEENAQNNT